MSSRRVIVGIGEVLWDLLPTGRQLGGAPANFACHAHALGAEARLISRVGNDELGREAIARLSLLGLNPAWIAVDTTLPTSSVSVVVDPGGQPNYVIHEHVAWDALTADPATRLAVADADAICFGSLAQRREPAHSAIRSLVTAAPPRALRIFDINLRQHYFSDRLIEESLQLANVLKVNEAELPQLANLFQLGGNERSQMLQLASRFDLRLVACTRGGRGSLLLADGQWSDHPGQKADVIDTVGAGDAFTAAMAIGFLAGWNLDAINECANRIAAYVCSQPGATPRLPPELREPFLGSANS